MRGAAISGREREEDDDAEAGAEQLRHVLLAHAGRRTSSVIVIEPTTTVDVRSFSSMTSPASRPPTTSTGRHARGSAADRHAGPGSSTRTAGSRSWPVRSAGPGSVRTRSSGVHRRRACRPTAQHDDEQRDRPDENDAARAFARSDSRRATR